MKGMEVEDVMKKEISAAVLVASLFASPTVFAAVPGAENEAVLAGSDQAGESIHSQNTMGQEAQQKSYKLRPGDQLSIIVTQQANMPDAAAMAAQSPFIIRPDGMISYPLVGNIQATGMTAEDFSAILQGELSRYVMGIDVSVNIVKLSGVRVYVFGEVQKPGAYELTRANRVIDAIGAAGSFTWDTAKKKIFLIHQDAQDKAIPINLNHMLQTGDMKENYELREGDVLYLTKNDRLVFSRDIAPIFNSIYLMHEATKN